jgi:hypothetical protein
MNRRSALRTIAYFALLPSVELLKFPEQAGCAVCGFHKVKWFHQSSDDYEDVSYQCENCGHAKCMVMRIR